MSGDVRRDFKSSVTHLVANTIGGERYDVSSHWLILKVGLHLIGSYQLWFVWIVVGLN